MAERNSSRPAASISLKVRPSMPGAPPFLFASRYASLSVSIFVTCTNIPQKRCVLSVFALRYIRRHRSCRFIGVFIISPLPHFERTEYSPVWALPSRCVLLHADQRYYNPIRHPDTCPSISHSRL